MDCSMKELYHPVMISDCRFSYITLVMLFQRIHDPNPYIRGHVHLKICLHIMLLSLYFLFLCSGMEWMLIVPLHCLRTFRFLASEHFSFAATFSGCGICWLPYHFSSTHVTEAMLTNDRSQPSCSRFTRHGTQQSEIMTGWHSSFMLQSIPMPYHTRS